MNASCAIYDFPNETKKFVEMGLWKGKKQFGASTAIGFANKQKGIIAGVVYHNFDPDSRVIEISAYSDSPKWLSKNNLKRIFDYPFNQLNTRLVIGRCSERNVRVRKIWKRLGADEVIVPKIRNHNENEIITILDKTIWKKSKYAKTKKENNNGKI